MEKIDSLDGERFVDDKTGNSLLFTFETKTLLVIDLDKANPKPDPDDPDNLLYEPLRTIYLDIKTGKVS